MSFKSYSALRPTFWTLFSHTWCLSVWLLLKVNIIEHKLSLFESFSLLGLLAKKDKFKFDMFSILIYLYIRAHDINSAEIEHLGQDERSPTWIIQVTLALVMSLTS